MLLVSAIAAAKFTWENSCVGSLRLAPMGHYGFTGQDSTKH